MNNVEPVSYMSEHPMGCMGTCFVTNQLGIPFAV